MCIGVPGKIFALCGDRQAQVDIGGVQREVDLTLVGSHDENGQPRLGQWVLIHVGFAMCVLDEHEARQTLALLLEMRDAEPDVGVLLYGGAQRP